MCKMDYITSSSHIDERSPMILNTCRKFENTWNNQLIQFIYEHVYAPVKKLNSGLMPLKSVINN